MDTSDEAGTAGQIPELAPERVAYLLSDAGHDVEVTGVVATPIGTGQMAGSYRVRLTIDGDRGGLPATMIAKIALGPPERRALSANSYRTEVDFYRQVASCLAARLPHCWVAWRNDPGDDFLLLLEDLAPWEPGDQLVGCDPAQGAVAVRNLAGVHGPVWHDAGLEELLAPLTDAAVSGTDAVFGVLTELFLSQQGSQLSADARGVCERFAPLAGTFLAGQRSKGCIIHGDYRPDNLLFAPDCSQVAVIDWQTVGLGLAARDLAFFVATSLATEVRRDVEDALIGEYHAALVGYGVDGYDLAMCQRDYAYGLFQVPLVVMFGDAIAEPSERGAQMFRLMIERGAQAMIDHDTLDRL